MKSLSLTLNKEGSVDTGIIRIPHTGYVLCVHLPVGNKFHSPNVELISSHVQNNANQSNNSGDDDMTAVIRPNKNYSMFEEIIFEIPIETAGAYGFHLSSQIINKKNNNTNNNNNNNIDCEINKENKDNKTNEKLISKTVRYIVDPLIQINGKSVPLGSLCIQTNYGRCIGKVKDWLKNLKPISDLGYNMIHLPPFEELGDKSHYSLKDQLTVSKYLFDDAEKIPSQKRWSILKEEMKKIEKELGIVFMADIVLNHTNPETEWLKDHPESGYNFENSPHLRPAYYVDKVINDLSNKIAEGKVEGLPPDLQVYHMERLRQFINDGLHQSELIKYFTIDIDDAVKKLKENRQSSELSLPKEYEMLRMRAVNYGPPQRQNILRTKGIVNNKKYDIGSIHVDPYYALALYNGDITSSTLSGSSSSDTSLIDEFRRAISTLNIPYIQHYEGIIKDIVTSVMNTFQYNRYDPNGPKLGPVTLSKPLVWRYFSEIHTKSHGIVPLANNGWIYSDNPTDDFICEGKECYLRRQVVIWGDNVKLRYGLKPSDNPWLWSHMRNYLLSVAEVVQGLRLDNAHSTPLPVSEYFIKEARKVNPNLYIVAELFTGSEDLDIKYINHIGINAFIREGAKHIEPGKMTHLLWSAGGLPVAAVDSIDSESVIRPVRQIPGVIFDLTHDNECPFFDPLPVSTGFSMSVSPYASNRGYDDLLPFVPSVVDEFRTYPIENNDAFHPFRRIINRNHTEMAMKNMNEIMANYYGSLVSIFRCNSQTGEGVWALIRMPGEPSTYDLAFPSPISELVFEGRIWEKCQFSDDPSKPMKPSVLKIFLNEDINKMSSCRFCGDHLNLCNFPENSVVVFRTKLADNVCKFVNTLTVDNLVNDFRKKLRGISIIDLAIMLYRCKDEEWVTLNHGAYDFPGFGAPFYAGTVGVETAFRFAAESEAGMGSAVFTNVRDGNWLIDFIRARLFQCPKLISVEAAIREWVEEGVQKTSLPRFLVPKYLDRVVRSLNIASREIVIQQMSSFIQGGDDFVQSLAMSSISFYTPVNNAPLVNPSLAKHFQGLVKRTDTSTAAGFPHFSVGFMRSWGRDTMIALRGLFLVTGRFSDAKDQLIAFASCCRHGLIPNLHDGCMNPRYNARDATWWFLQALQDYAQMSGEGGNVFQIKVPVLFPTSDINEFNRYYIGGNNGRNHGERPDTTMEDIVMRIMNSHANGIHFVEWNAGPQIDSVMKPEGFHVDIVTDWTNGFILGGNANNCGTWMDKMGSSDVASNKGVPATPRDGADIEIIGLLQSTLRWLDEMHREGSFAHEGVNVKQQQINKKVSWSEWSALICSSFESWFYVPTNKGHDHKFFIEEKHVGIRGIYKDTVGSSSEFADYQFRPNLCIAMTVAPELFDPVHAVRCLNLVEERLMGKIGMKTLDPLDFRYRPFYRNSEDSADFYTAKGFNYHNGPEWVWPVGYFFRASMRFRRGITPNMKQMLAVIKKTQLESWACGLPELTQKDGEPCGDGCDNQAWSVSAILDILYDYSLYTEKDMIEWDTLSLEEEDENSDEK